MNITKQLRTVLGPAIEASRAALRDLDDKEIPAKLRPVAKRSGGKLPVPLVSGLLRVIDEDEHFRGKALEAFERRGSDDAPSAAYLRRSDGWWITVSEAVAAAVVADGERDKRRLEIERDEARAKADSYRSKLRSMKKKLQAAGSEARSAVEDRLGPLKAAIAEAQGAREKTEARLERLRAEIEEVRNDRLEAERIAASLGEQVRKGRRTIAELRRAQDEGTSESLPRNPVDLARWLDRTAAMAAPYREAVSTTGPRPAEADEDAGPLLPAGIAPDTADAVESLGGVDGIVVLVDGHNVLGVIDSAAIASGRARRRLVTSLGRLMRHLGSSSVIVVFDSDLEGGREETRSDDGVIVRYAPADRIADDVIVDLAADHGSAAVVISNDREVRERSTLHGATVLWARALADWL